MNAERGARGCCPSRRLLLLPLLLADCEEEEAAAYGAGFCDPRL